jgi:hypothetical protein
VLTGSPSDIVETNGRIPQMSEGDGTHARFNLGNVHLVAGALQPSKIQVGAHSTSPPVGRSAVLIRP